MKASCSFRYDRLLFRGPTPDNAESIFDRYAGDPDVSEFLAWPIHCSIDDTRAFLAFSDTEWRQSPVRPFCSPGKINDYWEAPAWLSNLRVALRRVTYLQKTPGVSDLRPKLSWK